MWSIDGMIGIWSIMDGWMGVSGGDGGIIIGRDNIGILWLIIGYYMEFYILLLDFIISLVGISII
jgi:hypothetical protein